MKKTFKSPIHCGRLIRDILKQKGLKHRSVYEKMGYDKTNFSLWLKRPDWSVGQIFSVSEIIKVNLFSYFVKGGKSISITPGDSLIYEAKSLESDLLKSEKELKKLEVMNELQSENNNYLKKHIKELEKELNELKINSKKNSR